jgi:transcriptional regulator with XRE-family HTH domain
MATANRRTTRTDLRSDLVLKEIGREIRLARRGAGVSQSAAGRAARLSHVELGRIERGAVPRIPLDTLVRACDAVGLRLSVRAYPDGDPVRDAGHLRLLHRLKTELPASVRWRMEVPLPRTGDRRAWDAVISSATWSVAVEAETRIEDAQALLRRITLKQRGGGIGTVVLLVARTLTNRAALGGANLAISAAFPFGTRACLAALRAGVAPPGNGVVLL